MHTHPQHEQLTDYYPCLSSCVSIHLNYLYYNIRKIHIATKNLILCVFIPQSVCLFVDWAKCLCFCPGKSEDRRTRSEARKNVRGKHVLFLKKAHSTSASILFIAYHCIASNREKSKCPTIRLRSHQLWHKKINKSYWLIHWSIYLSVYRLCETWYRSIQRRPRLTLK